MEKAKQMAEGEARRAQAAVAALSTTNAALLKTNAGLQCEVERLRSLEAQISELQESREWLMVRLRGRGKGGSAANYEIGAEIDGSGVGRTFAGKRRGDGFVVAIKVVDVDKWGFTSAKRIWQGMTHPYVVACYDVFCEGDKWYIVTELATGNPIHLRALIDTRGKLKEEEVVRYLRMISEALAHVHGKGVLHRNVEPRNLFLFADGMVRLGGFEGAVAKSDADGHWLEDQGSRYTLEVQPPERLSGGKFVESSDVYAAGVVCYWCLAGKPPFTTAAEILMATPGLLPPTISRLLASLVMKMLSKNAEHRPSCEEILALPWMKA